MYACFFACISVIAVQESLKSTEIWQRYNKT